MESSGKNVRFENVVLSKKRGRLLPTGRSSTRRSICYRPSRFSVTIEHVSDNFVIKMDKIFFLGITSWIDVEQKIRREAVNWTVTGINIGASIAGYVDGRGKGGDGKARNGAGWDEAV